LTASVLNAVPAHRTGVASGINNAVAAVGSLLLIAVLGSVALGSFDRSLDRRLAAAHATPSVTRTVRAARGAFVVPAMPAELSAEERQLAHSIVADSLAATVRIALWIAAALALAGALSAALTVRRDDSLAKRALREGEAPSREQPPGLASRGNPM